MVAKKRKYVWKKSVEEAPAEETVSAQVPAPPVVEAKLPIKDAQVLCDCGNPANPGDHQCWRCSHRT